MGYFYLSKVIASPLTEKLFGEKSGSKLSIKVPGTRTILNCFSTWHTYHETKNLTPTAVSSQCVIAGFLIIS